MSSDLFPLAATPAPRNLARMAESPRSTLDKLRLFAKSRGESLTSLARKSGLNPATFTKAAKRGTEPSRKSVGRVAAHFGVPPSELEGEAHTPQFAVQIGVLSDSPRPPRKAQNVPVLGSVAGAMTNNGFEIVGGSIDAAQRAPALENVPDAYALYVVGESMWPMHPRGQLIFVHPHRPYHAGDSVVIQTFLQEGGPRFGYIKTFVRETSDEIIAEQLNPKATIKFKKSQVASVHKVLTMNELFGL